MDMHLWFHDDDAWPRYLGTVRQALDVSAGVEARFAARIAHPLHEPRPQLIVMNKMMAEHEGFRALAEIHRHGAVRRRLSDRRLQRPGLHQAPGLRQARR